MNRDEILKMPAGREMDALIAERVFGAVDVSFYMDIWTHGKKGNRQVVKHYSTRIADAWEVVETIGNSDTSFVVAFDAYHSDKWMAAINGKKLVEVYADTAPFAVCRAALLACEVAK